jgi:hypothetical protein
MFYLKFQKSLPYIAGALVCLLLTGVFARIPFVAVVFAIGTIYLISEAHAPPAPTRTTCGNLRSSKSRKRFGGFSRIKTTTTDSHRPAARVNRSVWSLPRRTSCRKMPTPVR